MLRHVRADLVLNLSILTNLPIRNPEERPNASELRKHPYLILPEYWQFNGFSEFDPDS